MLADTVIGKSISREKPKAFPILLITLLPSGTSILKLWICAAVTLVLSVKFAKRPVASFSSILMSPGRKIYPTSPDCGLGKENRAVPIRFDVELTAGVCMPVPALSAVMFNPSTETLAVGMPPIAAFTL